MPESAETLAAGQLSRTHLGRQINTPFGKARTVTGALKAVEHGAAGGGYTRIILTLTVPAGSKTTASMYLGPGDRVSMNPPTIKEPTP